MTWNNTLDSCPLCEMDKRTHWYRETDDFVIAEKLGGGPFVVLKNHVEDPSKETVEDAHEVVESEFGKHEFRVLMNIVRDHWHAHIITDKNDQELDGE